MAAHPGRLRAGNCCGRCGEVLQRRLRSSSEDEHRLADRPGLTVLEERPVLHRGKEAGQPAELLASKVAVKLVPKDERKQLLNRGVAHSLERICQITRGAKLGDVELENVDLRTTC